MRDLEEEQRKLEINYDKILQNIFEKRNKRIQEAKSYPDFWLRVLSNHSVTKDFINEEDKSVLKYLKDIRYIKSDIDNVIILFLF
jgi:hypothetical protein